MAVRIAARPPLTGVHDERDEQAGRRLLRLSSVFVSGGYVAYAVMTIPMVAASLSLMDTWSTVLAWLLTFGTGIAIGPLAWRGSARRMQMAAAAAAAGYLVSVVIWWIGWNGQLLGPHDGVWFAQFPALAAIAAALAFRAVVAFGYLVVACLASVGISHVVRPATVYGPILPDIAWSIGFSMVFVAAAVMLIRTAAILDATRAQAYQATAEAAAANARSAERSRFGALTHDNVMSTLLLASRQGASTELAQSARTALEAIEQAAAGEVRTTLTTFDAISQIRAAVALIDPAQQVSVLEADMTEVFPARAVSAMAAATAEAVRNSRRHAGEHATTTVTVTAEPSSLRVEVIDDGVGFDPGQVPASRLGIAVSIRGRMSQVDGGHAQIASRPGIGTRVSLGWWAR
ncbi:ATP-binding protein [Gordonia rhizosphera]|uniref:Histidine kinase/HSP90-like ATPase domain-containing protein n=1 Tax=Gordonia rhizosphera NBRC 16068 TaxID=1108045 RepID=K6WB84_9ACTN|nr:ATP-binding protein [Gordonia rhizosphera]GAB91026.1 hypothetical protein GORHZ_121_00190 [Gordonia rhizosphera NBRC 16068]